MSKNQKKSELVALQLAEILPRMMMQMVRLGDSLPQSATNLTPQQLRMLTALDFAGMPMRMIDLSEQLGVGQSTVTNTSKRLIKMGLIERERSKDDDRVVFLSLSTKGKVIVRDLKQARFNVFEKICKNLEPEDCQKLLESHKFILEKYERLVL